MQGQIRETDIENGLVDAAGEGEGGQTERVALKYAHWHVKNREPVGGCCTHRGLSLVLRDNPEGCEGGSSGRGWMNTCG